MARRGPQPGRHAGRRGRRSGQGLDDDASLLYDQEGNLVSGLQEQPTPEQLRQAELAERQRQTEQRESIELSASISDRINARVKGLLGGKEAVRKIQALGGENEHYANFYQQNQESFDKILRMDLQGTYQALRVNAENRDRLYKELVDKNILAKAQLKTLQGIISPQPYLQYVRNLGQRQARNGAVALTPDDLENLSRADQSQLAPLVTRLKGENKLNGQEESRLLALGPKSPEQLEAARNQIIDLLRAHDAAAHTSYHASWLRYNENEQKLAADFDQYLEQYNTLVKGLVEQIQEQFDQAEQKKIREDRTRALTRETGLPIRAGQVLWGLEIVDGAAGTEHNHRLQITDITFASAEQDPTLHEDFQLLLPSLEPVIHFTSTQAGGQAEEMEMSATQFRKFLLDNRVVEKFSDQQEMEKELGIVDFVKPGQAFNYLDPAKARSNPASSAGEGELPVSPGPEQYSTVTIEKIENGKIYLDHPVLLDAATPGTTVTAARSSSELDYGEFARWYRKHSAVPETSEIEQLDNLLEQHHQKLINEMKWGDDHGAPISIGTGPFPQYLVSAYRPDEIPPITIRGVNDGKIELDQGSSLTPYQFYRGVLEHGLTRPTPSQLAELQQAAEAKKDQKTADKMAAIAADPHNPPDASSGQAKLGKPGKRKGIWDRIKEFWGNTQVLSLIEIYELFIKAPKERIQAWMKDKSERRQYAVGKEFYKNFPKFGGLNDLSTVYEDKLNGKFAADVKEAEEIFEKNKKPAEVFKILYEAPNKAVLKASLQFLSKKGQLRWEDDQKLWSILNKHLGGAYYPEKYHHDLGSKTYPVVVGDMTVKQKAPTLDIFDQCRIVIDNAWGTGTFDALNGTNEREYQTKKEATGKDMHKYEYMSGGIGTMLKKMLYDWENGVDVKQAEFDGLLSEAIDRTEVSAEQAFLLLVSAFSVKNPKQNNRTLLSYSRLNPYVGKLSKHQLFFYFASNYPELDENGKVIMTTDEKGQPVPKKAKFNFARFDKVFNEVVKKDIEEKKSSLGQDSLDKYTAGKNTIDWIQREVLANKLIKDKMAEKAGSADIDTMYYQYLGPLIRQENLHRVIGRSWNSLGKPEVVKNMYAGYNNQLGIKARLLNSFSDPAENETRAQEFADMVNGFVYFNNVLRNRIEKRQSYIRMTDAMFESSPLADKKRKTIEFCSEAEQFAADLADQVADLTGDAQLKSLTATIMRSGAPSLDDKQEQTFRDLLQKRILELQKRRPADLANAARRASRVLKGISGTQLTAAEMEKAKE